MEAQNIFNITVPEIKQIDVNVSTYNYTESIPIQSKNTWLNTKKLTLFFFPYFLKRDHHTAAVLQKLSTRKHCDINLKAYDYNFGGISQCRFTVKSIYPAAVAENNEICPLLGSKLSRKAQKQLFQDEASSKSKLAQEEQMEDQTEDGIKAHHSKKEN